MVTPAVGVNGNRSYVYGSVPIPFKMDNKDSAPTDELHIHPGVFGSFLIVRIVFLASFLKKSTLKRGLFMG
jgi:hypothetical protein